MFWYEWVHHEPIWLSCSYSCMFVSLRFFSLYHNAVSSRVKELAFEDLEANEIVSILTWVLNTYKRYIYPKQSFISCVSSFDIPVSGIRQLRGSDLFCEIIPLMKSGPAVIVLALTTGLVLLFICRLIKCIFSAYWHQNIYQWWGSAISRPFVILVVLHDDPDQVWEDLRNQKGTVRESCRSSSYAVFISCNVHSFLSGSHVKRHPGHSRSMRG